MAGYLAANSARGTLRNTPARLLPGLCHPLVLIRHSVFFLPAGFRARSRDRKIPRRSRCCRWVRKYRVMRTPAVLI